jgi:parallel beta-helix repeat protein
LTFTFLASDVRSQQNPLPPCPHLPAGAVFWTTYFGGQNPPYNSTTGVATIAANDIVYLNQDPGIEISLLIVEGSLVFDHCWSGRELAAASILVINDGVLQIGSSVLEFPHPATIRLIKWPDNLNPDIPNGPWSDEIKSALLDRGLVVADGGTLRLYGKDHGEVWTRLDATAAVDDLTITMADPILDLESGDEIVIASTDFDQNQAEVRTVDGAGNFDALDHMHYGVVQNFDFDTVDTWKWDVDERAEVGLLSRNIKVIGMEGSSTFDHGHVFFYRTSTPTYEASPPRIEISWVEFNDLGIGGVMGRYPVHFHMIGDLDPAPTLFIENSSVRDSHNRGIAVHETSDVRIENNVVHNVMGHGIYLEDHSVKDCDVLNNLSLVNWIPENPAPSALVDWEPGNITLRSLNNNVQGNVAAGSAAYGIYLELYNEPFELETGDEPVFAGNSAHSCEKIGIYENHEFEPEDLFTFADSRVWKCREYGMWIRSVRNYAVDGLVAADCRSGFYPASKGLRSAGEGQQLLTDGLFVGETDNLGEPTTTLEGTVGRSLPQLTPKLYEDEPNEHELDWDTLNAVEMYDGFIEITNCRFAEFEDRDLGSAGYRFAAGLTQVAKVSTWINDPRNRVSGLEFHDTSVDRTVHFRDTANGNNQIAFSTIVDEDDSLGYGIGVMLMPNTPFLTAFQGAAMFESDSGTAGLNGYYVPLSSASYGQVAVRLNTALEDWLDTTYWRRVDDPAGTPDEGAVWECASVPTATIEGGGGAHIFPVVVEVGHGSSTPFYKMTYETSLSSGFPADLTIWYRFAPDTGRAVFLEIPYDQGAGSASGRPSAVKFWDVDQEPIDAIRLANPGLLFTTTFEQAWSHYTTPSGAVLILKLTSIELEDFELSEGHGSETRFEIFQ